jgi:hypothetical protein
VIDFLRAAAIIAAAMLVLEIFLTVAPRLGGPGRRWASAAAKAPLLDVIVALLTWVPWVAASIVWGWRGFVGSAVGQLVALGIWITLHEIAHWRAVRGPRIVTFINRAVGRWRNHAALWVTAISLPIFWLIRAAQIFLYPLLVRLLNFPRYRHDEWINVSRQKFDGLVGHDLLWCLYCDWMTGVYALGAEMLRNVESFWCPIRFADGKKCDNCKLDFPDIDGGWVPASGTMADVAAVMESRYGGGRREWFGPPARRAAAGAAGGSAPTAGLPVPGPPVPVTINGAAPAVHVPPGNPAPPAPPLGDPS